MLLDSGADADATDEVSQPTCLAALPLSLHGSSDPGRVGSSVAERGCLLGGLISAAWSRCAECRRAATQGWGSDCSASQCGRPALVRASESGHADIVRMLLDRGANVDAADPVSNQGARRSAREWSVPRTPLCVPKLLDALSKRLELPGKPPRLARVAERDERHHNLHFQRMPGSSARLRAPSAVAPTTLPRHLG